MKISFLNTFFISFGLHPIQHNRLIESSLKTIQGGLKALIGICQRLIVIPFIFNLKYLNGF